ncbi:rfaE bifunctional protein kinase chain/domain [Anaerospora hongkongensis]|uniref:RfaE bifunctional protein kinase chain/domain n=1 Tax=Anaerospora hongkongensis TaxID=244830 RepID=A0A4R1PZ66_9FIRM|nr:PfkB family carbohydrate kinase [Anaerospora hongkongensis]TCL36056.1 rfaE bifunctional protein kinase chain/domain [Anaerospora hongkongensis]
MRESLLQIVTKMQDKKVMLIGDMIADVYLEGRISRISREAPVLILEHTAENVVPGGAANAVHNTATLGGKVYAVGIVGNDFSGQELTRILGSKGVVTAGFIPDDSRPTITKTRVMAGGQATVRQQVVRIDRENKAELSPEIEQQMIDYIQRLIPQMDAVVLSDYGGVTVTQTVLKAAIEACHRHGKPSIVDSRYKVMAYKGITLVKQNESEAAAAVGLKELDTQSLLDAGKSILSDLQAEAVLITQGPDGMTLFEKTGKVTHIPVTNVSEVYDVTGAGDTVVAAMILAVAAGAAYEEAACLANFAAGIVVRKPGTATATPKELRDVVGGHYEAR